MLTVGYLFISTLVPADDMKEYIHPVYVLLDVGLDVRLFASLSMLSCANTCKYSLF